MRPPERKLAARWIVWAVLVLCFTRAYAQRPPEIESLLQSAQKAISTRPPVSFSAETDQYFQPGADSGQSRPPLLAHYSVRFQQDGPRRNYMESAYGPAGVQPGSPPANTLRQLWDGSRFYSVATLKGSDTRKIQTSGQPDNADIISYRVQAGSDLDGFITHYQKGSWADLLLSEPNSPVQYSSEAVDGHDCAVLKAKTQYGEFDLWIDPKAGYGLRKATITVNSDDLHAGTPLGTQTLERQRGKVKRYKQIVYEVKDVKIDDVDGVPIATAGTMGFRQEFTDGTADNVAFVIHRGDIRWNPNFDELGAFNPGIKEGERAGDLDLALPLIWRGGRFAPYINPEALKTMEKSVASALEGNQAVHTSAVRRLQEEGDGGRPSAHASDPAYADQGFSLGIKLAGLMAVCGAILICAILYFRRSGKGA